MGHLERLPPLKCQVTATAARGNILPWVEVSSPVKWEYSVVRASALNLTLPVWRAVTQAQKAGGFPKACPAV